jgi:hypothetical protein
MENRELFLFIAGVGFGGFAAVLLIAFAMTGRMLHFA